MVCYVNRIFSGVGISAFFLGQKVTRLTMGSLWNIKLLFAMGG
jgi:hypothetical protein